jgi:GNAT superfamily N-acetyltransferase
MDAGNQDGLGRTESPHFVTEQSGFRVSTDPAELDAGAVHAFLSQTEWARGVGRDVIERSLRHSLCFGLYIRERQIGLARVITDRATFGYLADVYVIEEFRGRGLGQWLIESVLAHPELQTVRRLLLATRDAHDLYTRFGFAPLARPEDHLERRPPKRT